MVANADIFHELGMPPFDEWGGVPECSKPDYDPEAWFPAVGVNPREARRICGDCDVRESCLDWAVDAGNIDGVWGATTVDERRMLRLRRRTRAA